MSRMKERAKVRKGLGKASVISVDEYEALPLDSKVEMIRALIPLGLMEINRQLEAEVSAWAGTRPSRESEQARWRKRWRQA